MGDRIARVGPDRHFQCRAGLVVLLLLRVQDGEVVVGLGQFGEVFGQLGEDGDGIGRAPHFGEDQSAHETALRVTRFAGDVGVRFVQGLRQLALLHQALDVGQALGICHRDRGTQDEAGENGRKARQ